MVMNVPARFSGTNADHFEESGAAIFFSLFWILLQLGISGFGYRFSMRYLVWFMIEFEMVCLVRSQASAGLFFF